MPKSPSRTSTPKVKEVEGIEPENYNDLLPGERRKKRNAYREAQKGKCWYCGASLDGEPAVEIAVHTINKRLFPPRFFDWPIHLHHDHATGMTIGAVHAHCNAFMWEYEGK